MSTPSRISTMLRRILLHPDRGVAGLVDDLLIACREHGLQLDWQADCLRMCLPDGVCESVTDVPLRKSVFRAILTRVAVLCNERTPGSVSPYGGTGELLAGGNMPGVLRVAFVNTPDEQRLELIPGAGPPSIPSSRAEVSG